MRIRFINIVVILFCGFSLTACTHLAHVINYSEAHHPRYAKIRLNSREAETPDTLLIVSYNIELSRRINQAVELLSQNEKLKQADIICLQEMTKDGVEFLASELNYDYIYYPSAIHPRNNKEFGNAILSRLPIIADRKIILPLRDNDKLYRIQRNGIQARIQAGQRTISVISAHLGAMLTPEHRRRQAEALLDSLDLADEHIIIAGDFNTYTNRHLNSVIDVMSVRGFRLASTEVKWTYKYWYLLNKKSILDLAFVKGFTTIASGSIEDKSASDHLPIWIKVKLQDSLKNL